MRGGDPVAGLLGCIVISLAAVTVGSGLLVCRGRRDRSYRMSKRVLPLSAKSNSCCFGSEWTRDPSTASLVRRPSVPSVDFRQYPVCRSRIWSMTGRFQESSWRGCAAKHPEPFSAAKKSRETSPEVATPSPATAAPAQPPAPPPDPFAACTFNPGDFRIGATQYTPDKFLQVGFDGSTARAVASLKDRLEEARQLAGNVGGSALAEVQRQARVLNYFDCRLKIEQASDGKK